MFLVRDEQGAWIPAAHYVAERENWETLSEALRCFKTWYPGWTPRYVMTDDSSIEQKAVKLAFLGLSAGEQEVSHLLCTVHSERTLRRRLGFAGPQRVTNCEQAIE
jgi:hypothetical protein